MISEAYLVSLMCRDPEEWGGSHPELANFSELIGRAQQADDLSTIIYDGFWEVDLSDRNEINHLIETQMSRAYTAWCTLRTFYLLWCEVPRRIRIVSFAEWLVDRDINSLLRQSILRHCENSDRSNSAIISLLILPPKYA